jgi:hypothetical protein
MRVFSSLLVPFFLSFACAQEEFLYSVSWDDLGCTEAEDLLSLDAIAAKVDVVLLANSLPEVEHWDKKVETNNIMARELEQDETRGRRDLCNYRCLTSCRFYRACAQIYNCDECRRRKLIQTERVLTHRELKTLEGELVSACKEALNESQTDAQYSQGCKDAMSVASCYALVYSPSSVVVMSSYDCTRDSTAHSVCTSGSQKYAVHARTAVTFAGVVTTIDGGDVGVSPGTSITMVETLAHKDGIITTDSSDFSTHVVSAHTAAMAISPSSTTATTEIGGRTFSPGTHHFDSAINIAFGATVTLDGEGDFVFQAGTTLITAADTYFILINGALAENILWVLGTAATLGARSVVEGSILAGTAITFGAQSELRGCALAQSAVTFETAGSVNLFSQPSPMCTPLSLSANACQDFAVHARTAVTFAAGGTINGGDVGVSPGTAITGSAAVTFQNGAISADSTDFAFDAAFSHSAAIAHRVDSIYKGMAIELGGQTFTSGTYRAGSSMNLAASAFVTLDGQGDPNSKFFFQAGTTLITGANTYVNLINGAKAENVLWALGSAATLGAGSIIQGSILAGTSITFGALSEVHGCALALAAITFPSAASVYLP